MTAQPIATAPLLTVDDVAAMTGIARQTLYKWRSEKTGKGPTAVVIGRRLRYRREDVDAWIDSLVEEAPNGGR